jgi:hypothetical protein
MSNPVVDHKLGYEHEDSAEGPVHKLITWLQTTPAWPGPVEDQNEDSDRKEQVRLLKVARARTIAILLGWIANISGVL